MIETDGLTRRQLRAIATVALLAPALRLIPGRCAALAGEASWLCGAAALPVLLLLNIVISSFLRLRREGEGMDGMLCRALGNTAGCILLFIFGLWLSLYAGFLLRSGADRFVSTIYPTASPWVFTAVMLLIAFVGAMGRRRSLGRASELVRPLLLAVLALVLISALVPSDVKNLLPVTGSDAVPVLLGAVPVADVVGVVLLVVAFLEGYAPIEEGRAKFFTRWTALVALSACFLCAASVGRLGADLVGKLYQPFFVLSRNVRLFGFMEHIEAPVTALWVFPDFVMVTLSLTVGSDCLRRALGYPRRDRAERWESMKNGGFLTPAAAVIALIAALSIAPTTQELTFISERIVPAVNLALVFALIPACYLAGKLRKRI